MRTPKLPGGLYTRPRSPFIYFSYRDAKNQQHMQSTEATDADAALLFKMQFFQKLRENPEQLEIEANQKTQDLGKLPLKKAAEEYFNWKGANGSAETIERERRLFRKVETFFGGNRRTKLISLQEIRKYQEERRKEESPTMKQRVTARTVNYEMQLLRGVMMHSDCWTDTLEARYQPLRQTKSDVGRAATKDELKLIFATAKTNESWQLVMFCAAVAIGTGCRGGELRKLQLRDIQIDRGKITIRKEISKNGKKRGHS